MHIDSASSRLSRRADSWAIGIALLIPSLVTFIYFVWLADDPSTWQQLAYVAGKTVQFGLPIAWVVGVQRQRVSLFPVSRRGWPAGIAFGLLVVAGMMALYFGWLKTAGELAGATSEMTEKVRGLGVASPGRYLALAAFYALVHSGLEEYYWRWFVFGQLRRLRPLGQAVVISGMAFMLHHLILLVVYFGWASPWTYLFSAAVAFGGVCWAWLYHRSGSIYASWISHLIVDVGIFLVGYDIVQDSLKVVAQAR